MPEQRHRRPRLTTRLAAQAAALLVAVPLLVSLDRPAVATPAPTAAAAAAAATGSVSILLNNTNGATPRYGPNEVVTVDAGNINYVRNCKIKTVNNPNGEPWRTANGVDDLLGPWADIYLVPAGRQPAHGELLSDVGGSANSVFGGGGGGFFYENLGATDPAGKLRAGVYAIVVDECQNGVFDTLEDTYLDDMFWVDLDEPIPPMSTATIAFLAMKDKAAAAVPGVDLLKQLIELQEQVKKTADWVVLALTGLSGVGGMMTAFVQIAILQIQSFTGYTALKDRADEIRKTALTQYRNRLQGLANDPPDPNVQDHAVPAQAGARVSTAPGEFDAAAANYVAYADALSAVTGAILASAEKYQGADLEGNAQWALRHARDLQTSIALYNELLPGVQAASTRYMAAVDAQWTAVGYNGFRLPIDGIYDVMYNLERGVVVNDYRFGNSGHDITQARAANTALQARLPRPAPATPAAWKTIIDAATARQVEFSATLPAVAAQIAGLETELQPTVGDRDTDPEPTVTFTGSLTAGGVVTATAGGVPAGFVVDWDTDGDGAIDDGTGVSTSFTIPGDTVVGAPILVTARVRQGPLSAIVTRPLMVGAGGNRPPLITSSTPAGAVVTAGAAVAFTTIVTDPDGDPLTGEWYVNGVRQSETTLTGFTFASTAADFGAYVVDLRALDGTSETWKQWVVRVITPDADNDTWMAAPGPDCDDTRPLVHPNYPEIVGNGLDDDCNPETSDDGQGMTPVVSGYGLTGLALLAGQPTPPYTAQGWTHPRKYTDDRFTMTIDWGDGTTSSVDSTRPISWSSNEFAPQTHVYTKAMPQTQLKACITWHPSTPGEQPQTGCSTDPSTNVTVLNNRPIVNPADFRTWESPTDDDRYSNPGIDIPGIGFDPFADWLNADEQGRRVITVGNPNQNVVLASGQDLPGGYGRVTMEHQTVGAADNDLIGLMLGYQPGELLDPAADYVAVAWTNNTDNTAGGADRFCTGTNTSVNWTGLGLRPLGVVIPMGASRVRGIPNWWEFLSSQTMPLPGAVEPSCNDDAGLELLGSVPASSSLVGRQVWKYRAVTELNRQNPSFTLDPYLVEYDYQPTSLTVKVNGVQQLHVTTTADNPFPPGGIGLWYRSQNDMLAAVSAPEKTFNFAQGKGGSFGPVDGNGDPVAPDGISVPMHDDEDDTHTTVISWGDGSSSAGTATKDPVTGLGWFTLAGDHVYEKAGTFRGDVCVTDDAGLSSCFPFTAVVAPAAPRVDAGPDRTVDLAVELTDMAYQDAGEADTHTATIDWGDGAGPVPVPVTSVRGGGFVPGTHTYSTPGVRTVEVCVTDNDGATACDSRVLTVQLNLAPTAVAGDPVTIDEGEEALVPVGFSDPNPSDTVVITVDPGDGSGPITLPARSGFGVIDDGTLRTTVRSGDAEFVHRYADNGVYDVTVTACDAAGLCHQTQTTVTVGNLAPTLVAAVGSSGLGATLTGAITDPGLEDVHSGTVNWGDGSVTEPLTVTPTVPGKATVAGSHPYAAAGTYTVTVTASDGLDTTTTTLSVVISESEIAVTAESSATGAEGDTLTLPVSVSGVADADATVTVTDVTDPGGTPLRRAAPALRPQVVGTPTATEVIGGEFEVELPLVDDGLDLLEVRVCDDVTGDCGTQIISVTTTNVAPAVTDPEVTVTGTAVAVSATFTDPGSLDTHTATVDFGDGAGVQPAEITDGTAQAEATGLEPGTYEVTVCVTDKDGGQTCRSAQAVVAAAENSPPTATVVVAGTATVGTETVLVQGSAQDPDGDPVTVTVDPGDGSGLLGPAPAESILLRHTYGAAGTFSVTTCVSDGIAAAVCRTDQVVVAAPPTTTPPTTPPTSTTSTVPSTSTSTTGTSNPPTTGSTTAPSTGPISTGVSNTGSTTTPSPWATSTPWQPGPTVAHSLPATGTSVDGPLRWAGLLIMAGLLALAFTRARPRRSH